MGFLDECNQEGLCDNLRHRDRKAGRVESNPVVDRCQEEDWKAFHRAECGEMYRKYQGRFACFPRHTGPKVDPTDDKSHGRHYPYRYRKFHTNLTRHGYETSEFSARCLYPRLPDGTPFYRPENVQTAAGLLFMDPDADGRRSGPVDEYLRKTSPYIPGYLKPRYEALASIFRKSVEGIPAPAISLDFKRRTTKPHIGSFRIIERVFRLGATDQVLILLMEQVRDLPDAYGTHEEMSDQVDIFCNRGAIANPCYTIIGSVNYTM
ncbi:hypothetical protein NMY22_g13591 [Coprinellus aureogranulatus]|nr:hypothetical protein NMY22_g13591 [Coprinellus aureogranulatus]